VKTLKIQGQKRGVGAGPRAAPPALMVLGLLFPGGAAHARGFSGSKPVILALILTDDPGWADPTLYGETKSYKHPNLNRLAARRAIFRCRHGQRTAAYLPCRRNSRSPLPLPWWRKPPKCTLPMGLPSAGNEERRVRRGMYMASGSYLRKYAYFIPNYVGLGAYFTKSSPFIP
jgi:hypothetical protein